MLSLWTEILPVFVFRWVARRFCGTVSVGKRKVYEARPDVFILAKECRTEEEGE